MSKLKWIVDVKGDVNGTAWEVSIVREDFEHGFRSWGWFGEQKLLVSHNGGPCQWPLAPGLGPVMVEIANRFCDYLNRQQIENISDIRLPKLIGVMDVRSSDS